MSWVLRLRLPYSMFDRIYLNFTANEIDRPWIDAMGGQGTTIIMAVLCLAANMSFLIMTQWGKRFRARTATSYLVMTQQRARSYE
jgi:hypothetical protein